MDNVEYIKSSLNFLNFDKIEEYAKSFKKSPLPPSIGLELNIIFMILITILSLTLEYANIGEIVISNIIFTLLTIPISIIYYFLIIYISNNLISMFGGTNDYQLTKSIFLSLNIAWLLVLFVFMLFLIILMAILEYTLFGLILLIPVILLLIIFTIYYFIIFAKVVSITHKFSLLKSVFAGFIVIIINFIVFTIITIISTIFEVLLGL